MNNLCLTKNIPFEMFFEGVEIEWMGESASTKTFFRKFCLATCSRDFLPIAENHMLRRSTPQRKPSNWLAQIHPVSHKTKSASLRIL